MAVHVSFDAHPEAYRHWQLRVEPPVAYVTMEVTPEAGLDDRYQLKLNSYDLGVDIELHDVVQRLRFEHPAVRVVVLTGGLEKVFCAGANIQMLAGATHAHKVNFCKFTNETRNAIEEATARSGQVWIAAINGTAAGGGYELALACDEILLIDDRASAVSLPEVPLLAVLPGTGGLTRVIDKRHVRRDRADVFATRTEGIKGEQALEWDLVDALAPQSQWEALIAERAAERASTSDRPSDGTGITLSALVRTTNPDSVQYPNVSVDIDRTLRAAHITVTAPQDVQPTNPAELIAAGADCWLIAACRELDDAILHLRFNEPEVGTWVLHTRGDPAAVVDAEALIANHGADWAVREVQLLWARTLQRLDVSARTLVALVDQGSCFTGLLAELALAADRSFMLDASDGPGPAITLTDANDGWVRMINGLSRLATRFWGRPDLLGQALSLRSKELSASDAADAGLVTFIPDEIDWDDEVRLALEERASFSPDALTGMEANLRFPGPETMETKIFARLSAWQNWIFQRPSAVGPDGALQSFGTGKRPEFDRGRV